MGDLIFPDEPRPTWPWGGSQGFETGIVKIGPGEQRRTKQQFPRYDFNLAYDMLTKAELQILFDFYRKHYGAGESFWYYEQLAGFYEPLTYYNQFMGYSDGVIDTYDIPGKLTPDSTQEDIIFKFDFTDGSLNGIPPGVSFTTATFSEFLGDRWRVVFPNSGSDAQIKIVDPIFGMLPASTHKARWILRYAGGYEHELISYAQATDGATDYDAYNPDFNYVYSLGQRIQFDVLMTEAASGGDYLSLLSILQLNYDSWQSLSAQDSIYDIFFIGMANDWGDLIEIYVNGIKQTRNVDYEVLYGGGSGNADRIKFLSLVPLEGSLITCDFTGRLRVKSRFEDDDMDFEWFASTLFTSGLRLKGILPNI